MSNPEQKNVPPFIRSLELISSGHPLDADMARNFLRQLYEYRAEVRNDLRRWFESVEVLARCFGKPYIPPMTPERRLKEDSQRFAQPFVHVAYRFQQTINAYADGEVGREQIRRGFLTEDYILLEESARYTGQKVQQYLRGDHFQNAVDVFREADDKAKKADCPRSARGLLDFEMGPIVREAFMRLYIDQRFDEVPERYLSLSYLSPEFIPGRELDLEQFPLCIPEIKKACIRVLREEIHTHPYSFAAIHKAFIEAGFLPTEGVTSDPELIADVEKELSDAIGMHPLVFEKLLASFEHAGFDREVFIKSRRLQDKMVNMLVLTMKKSPSVYLQVRDRWAESGLYDPELIDCDSRIQQAYMDVLEDLMKRHPFIYRRYRYRWSVKGLDLANYHMLDHRYEDRLLDLEAAKRRYGEDEMNESFNQKSDVVDREMADALEQAEQDQTRILTLVSAQDGNALRSFLTRYPQLERYVACHAIGTE